MTDTVAPNSAPNLGTLARMDVREVWPHEAHAFTPWLLANAEVLGEALGMDLELSAAEHPVGGFSLDLIGTNAANATSPDHGLEILTEIRQRLTHDTGLDVILSVAKDDHTAVFDETARMLGPRKGLTIDAENDPRFKGSTREPETRRPATITSTAGRPPRVGVAERRAG